MHLKKCNIQTLIHYPIPIHKQNAYKIYNNLNLGVTINLHNQILSLPISSVMEEEEIFKIINGVNSFII
jgi:dTDP-4-amino-4,6-dideoxygalactose transaminase